MVSLGEIIKHPDEVISMLKMAMAVRSAAKQIPSENPWGFCHSILNKISKISAFITQPLGNELANVVCIFYLILRALDTVEDDTSIPADIKVPILTGFHKHIYDRDWHFSCGTKDCKVLMDEFHHVVTAFLELPRGYQEVIEDVTKQMGAGMAKFISKEVESVDDYDEYCECVGGLVGLGLCNIFHAFGFEDLPPHHLSISMCVFVQKADIIRDYLEDINEIPKPRMFWPRQIRNKYVNELEELKYEENSEKAVQCLNDMVTNALIHTEDCLNFMSTLRTCTIFRNWAILNIISMGSLALCYNNVQVFRSGPKMRLGLVVRIVERTETMADVYGAFFDFSCMLKDKIDKNDPNANKTLSLVERILKICTDSETLSKRKLYIPTSEKQFHPVLMSIFRILHLPMFANESHGSFDLA